MLVLRPVSAIVFTLSVFALTAVAGCSKPREGGTPIAPASASGGRNPSTGAGGTTLSGTGGAEVSPGTGGIPAVVDVAPTGPTDTSSAAEVATGDTQATDGAIATPDYGMPGVNLACWADSKVIKICHQLENACENCPPGGAPPGNKLAAVCFDLIKKANMGKATDEDCAKFAVDNKCTVDNPTTVGNACGSLNCGVGAGPPVAADCPKAECAKWQQWGDASKCRPLMAKCPCTP